MLAFYSKDSSAVLGLFNSSNVRWEQDLGSLPLSWADSSGTSLWWDLSVGISEVGELLAFWKTSPGGISMTHVVGIPDDNDTDNSPDHSGIADTRKHRKRIATLPVKKTFKPAGLRSADPAVMSETTNSRMDDTINTHDPNENLSRKLTTAPEDGDDPTIDSNDDDAVQPSSVETAEHEKTPEDTTCLPTATQGDSLPFDRLALKVETSGDSSTDFPTSDDSTDNNNDDQDNDNSTVDLTIDTDNTNDDDKKDADISLLPATTPMQTFWIDHEIGEPGAVIRNRKTRKTRIRKLGEVTGLTFYAGITKRYRELVLYRSKYFTDHPDALPTIMVHASGGMWRLAPVLVQSGIMMVIYGDEREQEPDTNELLAAIEFLKKQGYSSDKVAIVGEHLDSTLLAAVHQRPELFTAIVLHSHVRREFQYPRKHGKPPTLLDPWCYDAIPRQDPEVMRKLSPTLHVPKDKMKDFPGVLILAGERGWGAGGFAGAAKYIMELQHWTHAAAIQTPMLFSTYQADKEISTPDSYGGPELGFLLHHLGVELTHIRFPISDQRSSWETDKEAAPKTQAGKSTRPFGCQKSSVLLDDIAEQYTIFSQSWPTCPTDRGGFWFFTLLKANSQQATQTSLFQCDTADRVANTATMVDSDCEFGTNEGCCRRVVAASEFIPTVSTDGRVVAMTFKDRSVRFVKTLEWKTNKHAKHTDGFFDGRIEFMRTSDEQPQFLSHVLTNTSFPMTLESVELVWASDSLGVFYVTQDGEVMYHRMGTLGSSDQSLGRFTSYSGASGSGSSELGYLVGRTKLQISHDGRYLFLNHPVQDAESPRQSSLSVVDLDSITLLNEDDTSSEDDLVSIDTPSSGNASRHWFSLFEYEDTIAHTYLGVSRDADGYDYAYVECMSVRSTIIESHTETSLYKMKLNRTRKLVSDRADVLEEHIHTEVADTADTEEGDTSKLVIGSKPWKYELQDVNWAVRGCNLLHPKSEPQRVPLFVMHPRFRVKQVTGNLMVASCDQNDATRLGVFQIANGEISAIWCAAKLWKGGLIYDGERVLELDEGPIPAYAKKHMDIARLKQKENGVVKMALVQDDLLEAFRQEFRAPLDGMFFAAHNHRMRLLLLHYIKASRTSTRELDEAWESIPLDSSRHLMSLGAEASEEITLYFVHGKTAKKPFATFLIPFERYHVVLDLLPWVEAGGLIAVYENDPLGKQSDEERRETVEDFLEQNGLLNFATYAFENMAVSGRKDDPYVGLYGQWRASQSVQLLMDKVSPKITRISLPQQRGGFWFFTVEQEEYAEVTWTQLYKCDSVAALRSFRMGRECEFGDASGCCLEVTPSGRSQYVEKDVLHNNALGRTTTHAWSPDGKGVFYVTAAGEVLYHELGTDESSDKPLGRVNPKAYRARDSVELHVSSNGRYLFLKFSSLDSDSAVSISFIDFASLPVLAGLDASQTDGSLHNRDLRNVSHHWFTVAGGGVGADFTFLGILHDSADGGDVMYLEELNEEEATVVKLGLNNIKYYKEQIAQIGKDTSVEPRFIDGLALYRMTADVNWMYQVEMLRGNETASGVRVRHVYEKFVVASYILADNRPHVGVFLTVHGEIDKLVCSMPLWGDSTLDTGMQFADESKLEMTLGHGDAKDEIIGFYNVRWSTGPKATYVTNINEKTDRASAPELLWFHHLVRSPNVARFSDVEPEQIWANIGRLADAPIPLVLYRKKNAKNPAPTILLPSHESTSVWAWMSFVEEFDGMIVVYEDIQGLAASHRVGRLLGVAEYLKTKGLSTDKMAAAGDEEFGFVLLGAVHRSPDAFGVVVLSQPLVLTSLDFKVCTALLPQRPLEPPHLNNQDSPLPNIPKTKSILSRFPAMMFHTYSTAFHHEESKDIYPSMFEFSSRYLSFYDYATLMCNPIVYIEQYIIDLKTLMKKNGVDQHQLIHHYSKSGKTSVAQVVGEMTERVAFVVSHLVS
eukprot:GHVQ01027896.1.p1 GENE.GHVQ01027896.1~~GHVQ01027896.1.p1  ORF type:complete len:1948 (-),score=216.89 GHVQ01027896.1:524-6367(-)